MIYAVAVAASWFVETKYETRCTATDYVEWLWQPIGALSSKLCPAVVSVVVGGGKVDR